MKQHFFDPYILKIDETVTAWEPTHHGMALATAMANTPHIFCGKSVIEIGCGSGIHSILALKLGAHYIDVTDLDEDILQEAASNAELNGVNFSNTWAKDWMSFEPQSEKYDFLLCNPPFCKADKGDRRWYISEMIRSSRKFLNQGGYLLFCQSSMADFDKTEKELVDNGYSFESIYTKRNIFRDYYFTEENFIEESKLVKNGFETIEDTFIETLRVYLCVVR